MPEFTFANGPMPADAELEAVHNAQLQDESFLKVEILQLWEFRRSCDVVITREKDTMRRTDTNLGELLYHLKHLLAKPGRSGGWSSWLKERRMPRATADRLVHRYAVTLPEMESPHESILEPTDETIMKLFSRLWPRLQKTLTTDASILRFVGCIASASGIAHEWREEGVMIFHPEFAASTSLEAIEQRSSPQPTDDPDGDVL